MGCDHEWTLEQTFSLFQIGPFAENQVLVQEFGITIEQPLDPGDHSWVHQRFSIVPFDEEERAECREIVSQ